jgi:hypothetical protein
MKMEMTSGFYPDDEEDPKAARASKKLKVGIFGFV